MYDRLLQHLRPHRQEHLLDHWHQLTEPQRHRLADQIDQIDFVLLDHLLTNQDEQHDWEALAALAEPPTAVQVGDPNSLFGRDNAIRMGEAALAEGKVGAILVAGGQGSRLGFPHPKGMFPAGPVSDRTLFQFHLDYLLAQRRRARASIPLYVMTSPATHDETEAYFQQQNYFGLPKQEIQIFCQGVMPAVDSQTGQLLRSASDQLAFSPDGHGGMLAAFEKSGCLADCQQRGLQTLFYFQVDNPLVRVCDAEFLGYHLLAESEMSTQAIIKQVPEERVGHIVKIDGRLQIIEYSDLPTSATERRNPDGTLTLRAGNAAVHGFDVGFLVASAADAMRLPYHRAAKQVPYHNASGELVEPEKPNATKFERFIFDLLPSARNPLVVEESASTAFAPVKNKSGEPRDTPETSRAALIAMYRQWLEQAGTSVPEGVAVEISPLFALDAAELAKREGLPSSITSDTFLVET